MPFYLSWFCSKLLILPLSSLIYLLGIIQTRPFRKIEAIITKEIPALIFVCNVNSEILDSNQAIKKVVIHLNHIKKSFKGERTFFLTGEYCAQIKYHPFLARCMFSYRFLRSKNKYPESWNLALLTWPKN